LFILLNNYPLLLLLLPQHQILKIKKLFFSAKKEKPFLPLTIFILYLILIFFKFQVVPTKYLCL